MSLPFLANHVVSVCLFVLLSYLSVVCDDVQCESKKYPPPLRFSEIFFPNGWEFLINFLHTYYTIISTLDNKFLFKYLQL